MSNPQLDFEVFEKPSICVFVTLKEYISRTHTLMTDSQSKLLLSYIKPYHQVSIGMMFRGGSRVVYLISGTHSNFFRPS